MDRTELKKLLQPFQNKCAEKGKPLVGMCLEEAYPGDSSTSYIVKVKASWIEGMSLFAVLTFLFDVLWETSDAELRRNVFSIKVLAPNEKLHCWQDVAESASQALATA